MKKNFIPNCAWILICFFNLSCGQVSDNKNIGTIEVNPELKNIFFNSITYSRNPSNLKVYKNDSLYSESMFSPDSSVVNAFIQDTYGKRLGFSKCNGLLKKDTLQIVFNGIVPSMILSIKASNNNFSSEYVDQERYYWILKKQKLILTKGTFQTGDLIKGELDIELIKINDGKDSIRYEGPFYFTIITP